MTNNPGETMWTVLLVEDHAATQSVLVTYLERAGFRVTAVGSAENVPGARERHGRPFDVVVSDVHLPGMSGIELASLLLAATPGQPIVLITGDPDEALAREALSRGPVNYLLKPFKLFELEAAIRNMLVAQIQRTQEPPPARKPAVIGGVIPSDWLKWVDDRSYAGAGHFGRLTRLVELLIPALPELNLDREDLLFAAECHEVGLMSGPVSDPIELAYRGSDLLKDFGASQNVVRIVRHMHERWDGTGGPDELRRDAIPAGSRVLSVIDAIDHYAIAWIQAGLEPVEAVTRAIGLVIAQQGSLFDHAVVRAVSQEREAIRRICGVEREVPIPTEIPLAQGSVIPSVATALLGRN
jgi:putative two-component system response regulator